MSKFLKMKETIMDIETGVQFIKDRYYEVIFEADTHYQLANQNNIPCGIGRELEGIKYDVVEKE